MNTVRILAMALAITLAAPVAAQAQDVKPAEETLADIDPAALAAARRLIVAAEIENTMFTFADQMLPMIIAPLARQSGLNAEAQALVVRTLSEEMRAEPDLLIQMLAAVYARRLSAADLNIIADFYETPTGKRLLTAQPALMADGAAVGARWGQEILGPRVQRRFQEMSAELNRDPT